MAETGESEIEVFGTPYEVTDGKIRPSHTVTVDQARDLEMLYPDAPGIQEAIRSACRDGLRQQRKTVATLRLMNKISDE